MLDYFVSAFRAAKVPSIASRWYTDVYKKILAVMFCGEDGNAVGEIREKSVHQVYFIIGNRHIP